MKPAVQYPFTCKNCSAVVRKTRTRKNSKAHRMSKCTSKCDGIAKDLGGFPVNRLLRYRFLAAKKLIAQGSRQLNSLTKDLGGFYSTKEWRTLRAVVLKEHRLKHGRKCNLCLRTDQPLHVDHIKPRSHYPELELVKSNLQVLCEACNIGKGAWDQTDWRKQ